MLLWASTKLSEVLPAPARIALIKEVFDKQNADGGWTLQSLGPWTEHAEAPSSEGSNGYATALTAFVLTTAGVPQSRNLARAMTWLRSHQNRDGGYWHADSMNKRYLSGSMEEGFMRDAATAFASMALANAAVK
jgi:hypothetical protein